MAIHSYTMETERLALQSLDKNDGRFIFSLLNTEGWLKFIGDRNVHSLLDSENYIDKILNGANIFYWTVRTKENNATVGLVTFMKKDYLDYFDIGFAFLPQFSNLGYAYEASKVLLHFVKVQLQHETVAATTVPTNVNSIKLLKKLDFRFLEEIGHNNESLHVYINSQRPTDAGPQ